MRVDPPGGNTTQKKKNFLKMFTVLFWLQEVLEVILLDVVVLLYTEVFFFLVT